MALKQEIGIKLKILRLSHKDSLRSLANKVELSYSTLYKIENGDNYPSIEVLDILVRHFDVPFSYFFGESDIVIREPIDFDKWKAFGAEMETYNLEPEDLEVILKGILKYVSK